MGNQPTKEEDQSLLSAEESAFVLKSFKNLSGNSDKLKADVLESAWSSLADKELITYILGCCTDDQRVVTIKPFEQHYYVAVKGTLDEKSNFINCNIFHNSPGVEGGITPERLHKFVAAVLRSYFVMLDNNKTKQYDSWLAAGLDDSMGHQDINNYAEFLLKDLAEVQPVSLDELENWLHRNPLWLSMWKEVVEFLYGHKSSLTSEFQLDSLPICELPPNCTQITKMLSPGKIMFLNDQLPTDLRCKWRLLFNSDIHGESFATFLGKIMHRGPTLIIVQDENDHIFGGFAPESWALGPKFVGKDTALLFTIQPHMQSFLPSGYNDHYQYLNTHQQTMPNGLGMGGQFDYWGLWLDCDYGNGMTSESCTTFKDYKQMSANKKFTVRTLEVWGVGEEPKEEEEDDEEAHGSVLDKNLDDKAVLEMAGREIYSEGLRDPDLDY